jgi:hypothetical protein
MKTIIILFMFFLIGAFFIISENLALNQTNNMDKFLSLYSSWLSHIFDNSKGISAYVIRMSWLPNETGK